jgi:hypothetical protein
MKIIFRNQVVLKDIKRLVNEDDKIKWIQLKEDILHSKLSIQQICNKHKLNVVRKMQDVKTTKNICYFNFRCQNVNTHIYRNVLNKKENMYEGMEIICRKYEKTKDYLLNTNYSYTLKKLGKYITIREEIDNIDYRIPNQMFYTHFTLPYALTCDSIQGISFNENDKVTIFDSNLPYTDRKYLWTAITRARKLDNIQIFIHSDEEVERFTESKIKQYFNMKVQNYKAQDNKANRIITEDYINEEWIKKNLSKSMSCKYCNKNMSIYVNEDATIESTVTVNRINNKIAHTIPNCEICCLNCNVSRK